MKTTVQTLKSRIDTLEAEIIAMRRVLGATMEKKDSKAWGDYSDTTFFS